MTHVYNDTFFEYIEGGARSSAKAMIGLLTDWLQPQSVLDIGCGRGVWLDEWSAAGVTDFLGVDGDYVDPNGLAIPSENFRAADLTRPLALERRFDLAQSLEVGEHLPLEAADALVNILTSASEKVLFSAAVIGQGGEFHINEQPLSFWQKKFEARCYRAYDCVRPHLKDDHDVEPWYRYNSVLYVKETATANLPEIVRVHRVADGEEVRDAGSLLWNMRKAVVSRLPQPVSTAIAQCRASVIALKARQKAAS